jgi:hypothetical protein
MDSTRVSEALNTGSIPVETTNFQINYTSRKNTNYFLLNSAQKTDILSIIA